MDGQVDGQMEGATGREDTQTDGQRGEKDGGGGEGLESPWTPWARSGPLGCHRGRCLQPGSHLFQALHVFEVEANIEEAQV